MHFPSLLASVAFVLGMRGVSALRPPYCQNRGLQYSAYKYEPVPSDDDFNPAVIQHTRKAFEPRVWHNYDTVFLPGNDSTFWNEPKTIDTEHLVVNQIGYIYAPFTGTYVFNVTTVNDAMWLWFGHYAYSGFSNDNANFYTSLEHSYPTSYEYNMVAGQYYPYRMVLFNSYGEGYFNMTITTPHAGVALSTAQLVYFGCDGAAPIFPDYNSSTTT